MNQTLCNCEHAAHFPDHELYQPDQHPYLKVPASEGCIAYFVGEICRDCAEGHMAEMLVKQGTDEEFSEAWYSTTLAGEEKS